MRRRLGQHFLKEGRIMELIVEYAELDRGDVVLEPGCGDGGLTALIARRAGKVIAVEIDDALAIKAALALKGLGNVELLVGDVLEIKPSGFNKVVANPPYSISTRLLTWITEKRPEVVVMTLQREFAEKLMARPGSENYVYISVMAQLSFDMEVAMHIPSSAFSPRPKVASSLLIMRRKAWSCDINPEALSLIKKMFTTKKRRVRAILKEMGLKPETNIPDARLYTLTPQQLYDMALQIVM